MTGKMENSTIPLSEKNVLHYAGQKNGKVCKNIKNILFEEINECKNLSKIQYSYIVYNKNNCPIPVYGDKLTKILRDSKYWAFFILTIGPFIEQKIYKYFKKGSCTRAIILNASANELVEKAADYLENIIRCETNCKTSTPRFSPGYCGWDLSVQPHILKHLKGESLQVTLNKSNFLIPQKTITAVMGLGGNYKRSNSKCDDCNFNCEFRRSKRGI